MFSSLEKYGFPVKKKYPGVYYIEGLFIPVQVVVTKELESRKHLSLKVLSRNAGEEDIRNFVKNAQKLTGQGELANVDAILQVSVQANHKRYEEMKRRFPAMCEALKMLMWDEIEDEVQKGIQKGRQDCPGGQGQSGDGTEMVCRTSCSGKTSSSAVNSGAASLR